MTASHIADLLAFWIQSAQQNPVVVQFAQNPVPVQMQNVPESWVKWLLPTIVQTVISLAAIGSGVRIAHWSFVKNRDQEQKQWERNQEAAHDRWLRDQRKAEWREVLDAICNSAFSLHSIFRVEQLSREKKPLSDKLRQEFRKVLDALNLVNSRIFIESAYIDPIVAAWEDFAKRVEKDNETTEDIGEAYSDFIGLIRRKARQNLAVEEKSSPDE